MRVIPPMDEEPPHDFVVFVTLHAAELRAEAARLVGAAPAFPSFSATSSFAASSCAAESIYLSVLTDVAGRWRRLRWWGRLTRSGAAGVWARQRLTARGTQWREEQIYEVEVRVLRPADPPLPLPPVPVRGPAGSLALRKAAILPGTARAALDALADAEIAWIHAHLKSQRRRLLGHALFVLAVVGALFQYLAWLSTDPL